MLLDKKYFTNSIHQSEVGIQDGFSIMGLSLQKLDDRDSFGVINLIKQQYFTQKKCIVVWLYIIGL